jgi:hypothetical protein
MPYLNSVDLDAKQFIRKILVKPKSVRVSDLFSLRFFGEHAGTNHSTGEGL